MNFALDFGKITQRVSNNLSGRMSVKKHLIPCPHEADPKKSDKHTFPNHHPLTRKDLQQLLEIAPNVDVRNQAKIQCRIHQAVLNWTCPNPGPDSTEAKIAYKLDTIYVNGLENGNLRDQIDKISDLIVVVP